jgi:hypothetical protein
MILQTANDLLLCEMEKSHGLRQSLDEAHQIIDEQDESIWKLQQTIFALQYPELWARIKANAVSPLRELITI